MIHYICMCVCVYVYKYMYLMYIIIIHSSYYIGSLQLQFLLNTVAVITKSHNCHQRECVPRPIATVATPLGQIVPSSGLAARGFWPNNYAWAKQGLMVPEMCQGEMWCQRSQVRKIQRQKRLTSRHQITYTLPKKRNMIKAKYLG